MTIHIHNYIYAQYTQSMRSGNSVISSLIYAAFIQKLQKINLLQKMSRFEFFTLFLPFLLHE